MSFQVTIKGRIVKDPEVRFTNSGKPVASFTVVTSRRVKNQATDQWEDADTTFTDVSAFGEMAENIAESCPKGTSVIVVGNMKQRDWQTKEGEKRKAWEVLADDVAVSCRWAKTEVSGNPSRPPVSKPAYDENPPFLWIFSSSHGTWRKPSPPPGRSRWSDRKSWISRRCASWKKQASWSGRTGGGRAGHGSRGPWKSWRKNSRTC